MGILAVVSNPPAWLLPLLLAGAYALGGISPGWFLVRLSGGGDVRRQGSGATGATNVGRLLGVKGFILVLALDAAKGAIAVIGVRLLDPGTPWAALALPAVIAGHIWPPWLRFQGGKGAGPLLGGCLALDWAGTLASVVIGILAGLAARNRFLAGAVAYAANLALLLWRIKIPQVRISYLFGWVLVLLAHRAYFLRDSKS
ncbi:MAG TPA: glycerol-3-phosphate acyltransferase [Opitutaceae bacterium]|nr:glycerol-3-phosphate acyltransferase [Opitutaceae bacterium]